MNIIDTHSMQYAVIVKDVTPYSKTVLLQLAPTVIQQTVITSYSTTADSQKCSSGHPRTHSMHKSWPEIFIDLMTLDLGLYVAISNN